MGTIANNLVQVMHRVTTASQKSCRSAAKPLLLAVSKGQSPQAIRSAYQQGQRHFGENYLQEALQKMQLLADHPDICWHYIGQIQSNKTRLVAENFSWVHTVDRLKSAQRLDTQRPASMAPLNICLQVNIDQDPNKAGTAPEEVAELALQVCQFKHLKLRGLMTIPAQTGNRDPAEPFAALRKLMCTLTEQHPELRSLDTLSMGMSADLEAAIAEGATIVRVGTDIFGPRHST